ncbi:VOC family protein [Paracoccaceae bacterium]|nr:VOC family protein [Paracoccaceae bacterium]
MSQIQLEHVNVTVSDPDKTAAWMYEVFDWPVRWQGPALGSGRSVHVGGEASYVALYCSNEATDAAPDSYHCLSGLNHIGVVVADLDLVEAQVRKAEFTPYSHADYALGRRFYFKDHNEIEYEVVQY